MVQSCNYGYNHLPYKVFKPKRDFLSFDGDDVYKWLYQCNQYFEIEEILEVNKLKLATYYLDGMELYWHENFMSMGDQGVIWNEYIEVSYYRFGGQKDPLEELKDLEQEGNLEAYIQDFDMLWNIASITEKQALVFFLGRVRSKDKKTW